jgi:hypothetical protein
MEVGMSSPDWLPGEKRNRERLKDMALMLLVGALIGLWLARSAAVEYAEQQAENAREALDVAVRCLEVQEPMADSLRAYLFGLRQPENER